MNEHVSRTARAYKYNKKGNFVRSKIESWGNKEKKGRERLLNKWEQKDKKKIDRNEIRLEKRTKERENKIDKGVTVE